MASRTGKADMRTPMYGDQPVRYNRTYKSWLKMRERCNSKTCRQYRWYGARGITYDPRWESFAVFRSDTGERPEGTTLDRKDPDGNYTKENCRWATSHEQHLTQRERKRYGNRYTARF